MTRGQRQQSSDVAQTWLLSQKRALIEGVNLLPQENAYLAGHPLVAARGQAQAFYLRDEFKRVWILKKFLPGRSPNTAYIRAIQALVPHHAGFESGYERKVLSAASVAAANLPSAEFPSWIENTILMPRVKGTDWAYVADKVRDGTINLTREQRLLMCRNLSEKLCILENNKLSHRDLSSTNIFIDTDTWDVHLIDWDSLYHPNLTIPPSTTFGTNGYIAPFVRVNGSEDSRITWSLHADRFSMAILNVEFLTVEQGSPVTGDGGLFDQDEIYRLAGKGIDGIINRLRRNFPIAFSLFDKTLRADRFDQCPGPQEWMNIGTVTTAPSLKDVYDPQADFIKFIQQLQKGRNEIAAPKLSDIEEPRFAVPKNVPQQNQGPPAPRLSDLQPVDVREVLKRTYTPAPAAPKLSDIEDPFAGRKS